jgi:hypothetical protein
VGLLPVLLAAWTALLMAATEGRAEIKVVPSASLSERYDSNVFYAPRSLVSDRTIWDVVTTAGADVTMQHASELIKSSLNVGTTLNSYINNPELNYVSASGILNLNLDNMARRLLGRRIHVQVNDRLSYTPEQPAFVSPKVQGIAETYTQTYLIGIQTFRANSLVNFGTVNASYELSPTLTFHGMYAHALFRFGQTFVGTEGFQGSQGFFNITTQTASAGTSLRLSSRNTVGLTYTRSNIDFGGGLGFETQTVMAEYGWILIPSLTATVKGGVTLLSPGGTKHYTGNTSLAWKLSEKDRWTIGYTRSVAPSIFLVSTALLSQTINAGIVHQFTKRLSMLASANYALNETTSAPLVTFNSYGADLAFTYAITRNVSATIDGGYYNYLYGELAFDRKAVILSISATWP